MSKKAGVNVLLASIAMGSGEYYGLYTDDKEVLDCLMDLYFYMLSINVNEEREKKYFGDFSEKYKRLNQEQKEIVKKEYFDIVEARDREDIKIKRKGMNKYE